MSYQKRTAPLVLLCAYSMFQPNKREAVCRGAANLYVFYFVNDADINVCFELQYISTNILVYFYHARRLLMLRKTFVLLSVRLSSFGYYGWGESPCQRSGAIHQSLFYHHDVEHRSLNPRGSIQRSSILTFYRYWQQ